MTKFYFISDIHGRVTFIKKLFEQIANDNDYKIIILGDELYHGARNNLPEEYDVKLVTELLNSFADKIIAIRGNCDAECDQMVLKYPILDDCKIIEAFNKKLFLTHGHIYSPNFLPPINEKIDIFCSGHTHIPEITKINDKMISFNPGSIGLPRGNYQPSYGIMDDNSIKIINIIDNTIMFETKL